MMYSRRDEEFYTTSEQNICRLCGQCKSDIIAIFSDEAHRKLVLLKIQTRLLIQISANDPLPKNACNDCLERLDSLWEFFELCRKTQIKLRETFLNQRRGERVTLMKQTIDHEGSIGTRHPPQCSLKSITHQTTQDTLDSASGKKRIKLELVPVIKRLKKEELAYWEEKSRTVSASTVTSSAGIRESYRNDSREIGAESSKLSNISARLDNQQGVDNIVKKHCVSEIVDAIVRRNYQVLQNCDIGKVKSSVSLCVKKNDHQKATSSDLKDNSLGQHGTLQNVSKTKPIIDKQASLDCINSSAVQENKSRCSPVISVSLGESHGDMVSHRKDSSLASTITEEGRCSPVGSFVSDSDIQRGVSLTGTENSVVQQMEENLSCGKNQEAVQQISANSSVSPSENICQAAVLSGNSGTCHVQLEKDNNNMLENLLCNLENLGKERRDTVQKEDTDTHATKSITQEGITCSMPKEKDHISASINTEGLSGNSGTSHVQVEEDENSMLGSLLCINGNSEKEKTDSLQKEDADIHTTKSVTQEGIKCSTLEEKDHISASNNTEGLSGNSGRSHVHVEEDMNNMLGSLQCSNGNSEKEKIDTLQKEGTDTHATKSVTQEGIKCSMLEEKDHTSASHNTEGVSGNSGTSHVQVEEDVYSMLGSLLCINGNSEKEKTDSLQKEGTDTHATRSVTQEGTKHVTLEEKDHISAFNNIEGLSGNSGISHVHVEEDVNNMLGSLQCSNGNSEKEKIDTLEKAGTDTHALKRVTLEEKDQISASNNAGGLSESSEISQVQMEKDENNLLRNLLCIHRNLEKEKGDTLQNEDRDTHATKSVTQEGIKCVSEEKDHISASNNTVSLSDRFDDDDDDDGGGDGDGNGDGDDDDDDSDINECVDSFICHDCGNSFSCKNSLINHIFKQHMHTGQTNTLHATLPTKVTLKSSDSSKTELKPNLKLLKTELKPTTVEEAVLMCEKYSQRICETSGENPKINMVDIKFELSSGHLYTNTNSMYREIFKPFIVMQDSRYDCQICKATLNNRLAVVKHIGKHFNLFPYRCNICDKIYTVQESANYHIKLHLTKFVCEQCGKVCSSSLAYKKHMNNHNKPYSCHDCGKRFCSKARVSCHIWKEHMKIRTFACKICGKAYFHSGNVATHMIFAHADRKIVCQHCGKMYFRNNMLKEHIRRWHN